MLEKHLKMMLVVNGCPLLVFSFCLDLSFSSQPPNLLWRLWEGDFMSLNTSCPPPPAHPAAASQHLLLSSEPPSSWSSPTSSSDRVWTTSRYFCSFLTATETLQSSRSILCVSAEWMQHTDSSDGHVSRSHMQLQCLCVHTLLAVQRMFGTSRPPSHWVCFVLCVFQSSVNRLVSVVLSTTKDVPLWTFAHLQYKQQQVGLSSPSSCFRGTCNQTANHISAPFCLPGGAGGGSGCRRRRPGEAAGAEASGQTAGRAQRHQQVSQTAGNVMIKKTKYKFLWFFMFRYSIHRQQQSLTQFKHEDNLPPSHFRSSSLWCFNCLLWYSVKTPDDV